MEALSIRKTFSYFRAADAHYDKLRRFSGASIRRANGADAAQQGAAKAARCQRRVEKGIDTRWESSYVAPDNRIVIANPAPRRGCSRKW
jgi:hypothetical protein